MATLKNSTINDGIVELPDHGSAPSPTAGALYANTTSLYWEDNDLVAGGGGGAADKQTTGNTLSNSAATDSGPSQGYRLAPNASTTLGVIAKANTFMQGTFYNELILLGDVEAPGIYIRGEGTDDSSSITEQGPTGHTLTVTGAKYENTVSLDWNTTSILFDGSDDVITVASHPDLTLGQAAFTVEAWVYPDDRSGDMGIFGTCNTGVGRKGIRLYHKNSTGLLQLYASTTDSSNDIVDGLTSSVALTEAAWNHVAVTRVGNSFMIYVNGKMSAQKTAGGVIPENGAFHIGKPGSVGTDVFDGYMAEFRLTKGMTRYTGNFTPAQGFLSARMASFAIDATTFHSTDSPSTLDIGSRDRLGEDSTGDGGHCQVVFDNNYTINSTSYMIPLTFRNTSGHEFSLNYNIWPRALANTYMAASGAVFSASAFYGNRGVFAGGTEPSPAMRNIMEYVTISTAAESTTDFGDLSAAAQAGSGLSGNGRGIFHLGEAPTDSTSETLEFITIASTGNATDFGDLQAGRNSTGAASDSVRGLFFKGSGPVDTIDFITISTKCNGRDFGEGTKANDGVGGASNGSRALSFGGSSPSPSDITNIIDYMTIGTLNNAIDFGDLLQLAYYVASTSDGSRGVSVAYDTPGTATDDIHYVNINVTSNAIDFGGEQTGTMVRNTCVSNGSRAVTFGGQPGPGSASGTIDYFPIGVSGTDAVDFGELVSTSKENMSLSGD